MGQAAASNLAPIAPGLLSSVKVACHPHLTLVCFPFSLLQKGQAAGDNGATTFTCDVQAAACLRLARQVLGAQESMWWRLDLEAWKCWLSAPSCWGSCPHITVGALVAFVLLVSEMAFSFFQGLLLRRRSYVVGKEKPCP